MSQDDRQNFFAHDYDDLNEDEFCVFGGRSPNRSDDAQQVRARPVALIQSAPSQILLKKRKIQTNDSTLGKVKETLMSKSILPSGNYIELDPKGGFGTPVEISSKEDEQLADLIGEGIRYEVDRRLTNIVSCHHKKWIGVHLISICLITTVTGGESFFECFLKDGVPFKNEWSRRMRKCVPPPETLEIKDVVEKISTECYSWNNYHSPEALAATHLPPPVYGIQRQVVLDGHLAMDLDPDLEEFIGAGGKSSFGID
nr:hypothetical protein Iba_chr12bCG17990 [Ipomoea batatas]